MRSPVIVENRSVPPSRGVALVPARHAGPRSGTLHASSSMSQPMCSVLPSFTNTHLIDGTEATGLLKPVEPEDVAAAVLRQVRKPRLTATVPRHFSVGGASWSLTAAKAKPWLRRRLGLENVFTDYDREQRAEYDRRTVRGD